jgi:hypothetical protein
MDWLTPLYAAKVPAIVADRPVVEQKSLTIEQEGQQLWQIN